MSADEFDRPGGAHRIGFHSNADDTLRAAPPHAGAARAGAWGDGAWGDPDLADRPDGPPVRRRASGLAIGLIVSLVAAAAIALAWTATPAWGPAPDREAARDPNAPRLQAELAPVPSPAQPAFAMSLRGEPLPRPGPVPTLPTSPSPVVAASPPPPAPAAARSAPPQEAVARSEPPPAPAAAPAVLAPPPAQARLGTGPDCALARSLGQQLACEDPELADADRRMTRAYRAALAAGAPPDELRAEQQDWLSIREDAARHSHRAVAEIYEQRIEELRQWEADAGDRRPER
ncbi:hypothetical protein [Phenylobacterium sp.]|uniref:hypothetical protein n=1 Tax=Phenylobacterium sp. TaxID=1871053 RepID=UPI003565BCEA